MSYLNFQERKTFLALPESNIPLQIYETALIARRDYLQRKVNEQWQMVWLPTWLMVMILWLKRKIKVVGGRLMFVAAQSNRLFEKGAIQ